MVTARFTRLWASLALILSMAFGPNALAQTRGPDGRFVKAPLAESVSHGSTASPAPRRAAATTSASASGKNNNGNGTPTVRPITKVPNYGARKVGQHVEMGLPTAPSTNPNDFHFARNGFVGSFNSSKKGPNWIAYKVTPNGYGKPDEWMPRYSGSFKPDPKLPEHIQQPTRQDYYKSGFDQGHNKRGGDAPRLPNREGPHKETFLYSNVTPQYPNVNRGPWNHFEDHYRDIALGKSGPKQDVRVIVGHLFEGPEKTMGNGVGVPSHEFKIVAVSKPGTKVENMTPENTKLMAVMMPNNAKVRETSNFAKFIVPPSEIIKRSGWTGMLAELPPAMRASIKTAPVAKAVKGGYTLDGEFIKNPISSAVKRQQERDEAIRRQQEQANKK